MRIQVSVYLSFSTLSCLEWGLIDRLGSRADRDTCILLGSMLTRCFKKILEAQGPKAIPAWLDIGTRVRFEAQSCDMLRRLLVG